MRDPSALSSCLESVRHDRLYTRKATIGYRAKTTSRRHQRLAAAAGMLCRRSSRAEIIVFAPARTRGRAAGSAGQEPDHAGDDGCGLLAICCA